MPKIEESPQTQRRYAAPLVLVVCLALSIIVMKYDSAPYLLAPRAALDSAAGEISGRVGWFARLIQETRERRATREREIEVSFKLNELEEVRRENERLREELGLAPKSEGHRIHAEVVGKEVGRLGSVVLVDKGTSSGVREGWIACSTRGLVGKVAFAGERFSRVQLIINYNSPVSVRVQRSGVEGVVEWNPSLPNKLTMKFLQPDADIEAGDVIVSSGLGGVYPADLPVGWVSRVKMEKEQWEPYVEVRPFVDFSRLVEVALMAPESTKVAMVSTDIFNPDAD
ncbi:MAG: rod shape-determining protein MreC [Candidatus Eisenbacteria bacterium]